MFQINVTHPMPIHAQLEVSIRHAIMVGKLRIGEQLPTVRQLAVDLRINANTVAKVYAGLERSGVVETRRGIGTFVRARPTEPRARQHREKQLHDLVNRWIAEAGALGFSPDDLIDELQSRRKKEMKNA